MIQTAAQIIVEGGLVAFPTETVYGLGANALDARAVTGIFEAKGRPAYDPVIAHIYQATDIDQLAVDIPPLAWQLAVAFWPGPLTMVLKRHPRVPDELTSGLDTVAVRMPAHAVARALLQASGVPIGAPSANRFACPSPTTAQHVLADLDGRIDMVLDAGHTEIGLESTVVDVTLPVPLILRPGGLTYETLRAVVPELQLSSKLVSVSAAQTDESQLNGVKSPGMLSKHYSPRAELRLFKGPPEPVLKAMSALARDLDAAGLQTGLMVAEEDRLLLADCPGQILSLGPRQNLAQIGTKLFETMRFLDDQDVAVILSRDFGHRGLGLTIWDRLVRAAEGRVITISGAD